MLGGEESMLGGEEMTVHCGICEHEGSLRRGSSLSLFQLLRGNPPPGVDQ